MADRESAAAPNGTASSRIFDPGAPRAAAPRTTSAPEVPVDDEGRGQGVDRDPVTGRFLRPGFTSQLVSRARKLGLTDQDLADYDNPADLRADVAERAAEERFSRLFNASDAVARSRNGTGETVTTPSAELPAYEPNLDEEAVSPALAEVIRGMHAHYEGVIKKLTERLDKVEGFAGAISQREVGRAVRTLDKAFQQYPEIFGAGTRKDIKEGSSAFMLRMAAEAFHNENGGDPESLEANIEEFVKSRFGKKPTRPRRAVDEEVEDDFDEEEVDEDEEDPLPRRWQRGVLARPTQAGAREAPAGREKAVQNIRKRIPAAGARDARAPRGIYLNSPGSRNNRQ